MHKRRLVLISLLILLILASVSLGRWGRGRDSQVAVAPTTPAQPTLTPRPTFTLLPSSTPTPSATATPEPTATPDPYVNPLTGLRVSDPALVSRRPLAIRVGNDPGIRPQDGLGSAEVVIEEIMEGWGVTRFTGVYLGEEAARVRPLRSARLSSLSIAPQYDAALVHTGASDPIRWLISQASFVDLDQFFHPAPYRLLAGYDWRGRMYTATEGVHEYLASRGLDRDTPIAGYLIGETVPAGGSPAATVGIPYPGESRARWTFDADSGEYLRAVAGVPHTDGLTGKQIGAANVIALYAEHKRTDIVEDTLGSTAIDIVLSGSGDAQIARDGQVYGLRWEQREPGALIRYYDAEGNEFSLRPGKSWIEIVPLDYGVSYE